MIWTKSRPIRATPSSRFNELFCMLRTMLSINEIYNSARVFAVISRTTSENIAILSVLYNCRRAYMYSSAWPNNMLLFLSRVSMPI